MDEVGGSELRRLWEELVSERGPMTSHDVLMEMKARGLVPKGGSYKAQIRNLHSAATALSLPKVRPGLFGPKDSSG